MSPATTARGVTLLALLAPACGPAPVRGDLDASPGVDAPTTDAPAPTTDAPAPTTDTPGVDPDAGPAEPITAPPERWTWVPIDGARCGNGGPTGIGVNLTTRSHRVLIYLEGGGACWDANTCFTLNAAVNIATGYDGATFSREIAAYGGAQVFNRADAHNPFRDASYVFVPYCTGDLHDGTRVATYMTSSGARQVHHVGALNMALYLRRLAATFPAADRVWLSGSSAGGFGALLQWPATQVAFGATRVDLIDDSGPPITPPAAEWSAMSAAWQAASPDGCADCATGGLEAVLAFERARFGADHRYALLSYTQDGVVSAYWGVSGAQFEMELDAMRAAQITPSPSFNAYVLAGTSHVLLGGTATLRTSTSVVLIDWLNQMVGDDPAWTEAGP